MTKEQAAKKSLEALQYEYDIALKNKDKFMEELLSVALAHAIKRVEELAEEKIK